MDSLSQAMLGSTVALIATRGRQPRRAIMIGALLGTLPDLDVLVPFENDLDAMTKHRSWSHSWLVHVFSAPLFAVLLGYFDRSWSFLNRLLTCFLIFVTHSGLDALTIYGTWLFWPFGNEPVMGGSTFIIDPLYTLPLLLAVVWIWRRPSDHYVRVVSLVGFVVSSLYLCWGLYAKYNIEQLARITLSDAKVHPTALVATPTPFNSILWRVIAIDDQLFHEGYFSFLRPEEGIQFTTFNRGLEFVADIQDKKALDQFARFNHNFHAFSENGNRILGQDLRMGAEPYYFFQFEFGHYPDSSHASTGSSAVPISSIPNQSPMKIEIVELFGWLGQRLLGRDLAPLESKRNVTNEPTKFGNNAVKS